MYHTFTFGYQIIPLGISAICNDVSMCIYVVASPNEFELHCGQRLLAMCELYSILVNAEGRGVHLIYIVS